MLLPQHIPIYEEIFKLTGILSQPLLSFGFQDAISSPEIVLSTFSEHRSRKEGARIVMGMRSEISVSQNTHYEVYVPWQFMEPDFKSILRNLGVQQIDTLDLFDPRADIRHDMNLAVPDALKNRYASVIDIGSLEHVFDTRQCLKNLIDLVKLGGFLTLHVPCCGFLGHGLYTFNPELIFASLTENEFKIVFTAYSLEPEGFRIEKPIRGQDVILWCVAQKVGERREFAIPQQLACIDMYGTEFASGPSAMQVK